MPDRTIINVNASSTGLAVATPVLSSPVIGVASSGWAVSNSDIISQSVTQSQSSLGSAQNYELTTQELAGSIGLTSDFQGQLNDGENFTTSLGLQIKSTPTISSTARRNIVLKLREDLYGEIRIDDFTSEVTQVEGTTDFRGVLTEDQVSSTPSVFVMRLRTQATNNATLGYDVRQQVEDYFGILLVADNISDEYGVNSMDVIWAMHSKIIDSLLGWQLPSTEFDRPTMPLAYRGGVAYGLELDSYHWLDQFSCTSQICSYRNQVKPVTF